MHHSGPSFPPLKLEAYPGPGIAFDYNYNYNNLNSNISSTVTSNSISSPSPSTSSTMAKRALSDSDCEDLFTDTKDSCITPPGSETGGGHNVSRKKRRGIIEKRRRDRINNSLTELRRLVPSFREFSGGEKKVEKADILETTIKYLKGLDALTFDPHKFAMDYHTIGFRECSAEVARFLVAIEGMDMQDSVRHRLISHLNNLAAQRELANKQASPSSWGFNPLTPNHSFPLTQTHLPGPANFTNTGGLVATPAQHPSTLMDGSPLNHHHHQNYLNTSTSSSGSSSHTSPAGMGHDNGLNQGHHHQMGQRTLFPPPPPNHHSHIPREYNPNHPNPMTSSPYGMPNQNYPVQSGKPYRPWGAELAGY